MFKCEKAGCGALVVVGDKDAARRDGWHIPTFSERAQWQQDRHHVQGLVLCPRCWGAATDVIHLG